MDLESSPSDREGRAGSTTIGNKAISLAVNIKGKLSESLVRAFNNKALKRILNKKGRRGTHSHGGGRGSGSGGGGEDGPLGGDDDGGAGADEDDDDPCQESGNSVKQLLDDPITVTLQLGAKAEVLPVEMRRELWLSSTLCREAEVAAYDGLVSQELQSAVVDADILKDCHRTYPSYRRFSTPEGRDALRNVLKAYAAYDPDVAYCQGMNFVAGCLLMFLPSEAHAFAALVMMMKDRGMAGLYGHSMPLLQEQLWQLGRLLSPEVSAHMEACGVVPVLYAASWLMTCFAADFPMTFSARVLDALLTNHCESVMLKVAVSVMKHAEPELMECQGLEEVLECLKLTVPGWPEERLDEVLQTAFGTPWTRAQLSILASKEGHETVAQSMERVHNMGGTAWDITPSKGSLQDTDPEGGELSSQPAPPLLPPPPPPAQPVLRDGISSHQPPPNHQLTQSVQEEVTAIWQHLTSGPSSQLHTPNLPTVRETSPEPGDRLPLPGISGLARAGSGWESVDSYGGQTHSVFQQHTSYLDSQSTDVLSGVTTNRQRHRSSVDSEVHASTRRGSADSSICTPAATGDSLRPSLLVASRLGSRRHSTATPATPHNEHASGAHGGDSVVQEVLAGDILRALTEVAQEQNQDGPPRSRLPTLDTPVTTLDTSHSAEARPGGAAHDMGGFVRASQQPFSPGDDGEDGQRQSRPRRVLAGSNSFSHSGGSVGSLGHTASTPHTASLQKSLSLQRPPSHPQSPGAHAGWCTSLPRPPTSPTWAGNPWAAHHVVSGGWLHTAQHSTHSSAHSMTLTSRHSSGALGHSQSLPRPPTTQPITPASSDPAPPAGTVAELLPSGSWRAQSWRPRPLVIGGRIDDAAPQPTGSCDTMLPTTHYTMQSRTQRRSLDGGAAGGSSSQCRLYQSLPVSPNPKVFHVRRDHVVCLSGGGGGSVLDSVLAPSGGGGGGGSVLDSVLPPSGGGGVRRSERASLDDALDRQGDRLEPCGSGGSGSVGGGAGVHGPHWVPRQGHRSRHSQESGGGGCGVEDRASARLWSAAGHAATDNHSLVLGTSPSGRQLQPQSSPVAAQLERLRSSANRLLPSWLHDTSPNASLKPALASVLPDASAASPQQQPPLSPTDEAPLISPKNKLWGLLPRKLQPTLSGEDTAAAPSTATSQRNSAAQLPSPPGSPTRLRQAPTQQPTQPSAAVTGLTHANAIVSMYSGSSHNRVSCGSYASGTIAARSSGASSDCCRFPQSRKVSEVGSQLPDSCQQVQGSFCDDNTHALYSLCALDSETGHATSDSSRHTSDGGSVGGYNNPTTSTAVAPLEPLHQLQKVTFHNWRAEERSRGTSVSGGRSSHDIDHPWGASGAWDSGAWSGLAAHARALEEASHRTGDSGSHAQGAVSQQASVCNIGHVQGMVSQQPSGYHRCGSETDEEQDTRVPLMTDAQDRLSPRRRGRPQRWDPQACEEVDHHLYVGGSATTQQPETGQNGDQDCTAAGHTVLPCGAGGTTQQMQTGQQGAGDVLVARGSADLWQAWEGVGQGQGQNEVPRATPERSGMVRTSAEGALAVASAVTGTGGRAAEVRGLVHGGRAADACVPGSRGGFETSLPTGAGFDPVGGVDYDERPSFSDLVAARRAHRISPRKASVAAINYQPPPESAFEAQGAHLDSLQKHSLEQEVLSVTDSLRVGLVGVDSEQRSLPPASEGGSGAFMLALPALSHAPTGPHDEEEANARHAAALDRAALYAPALIPVAMQPGMTRSSPALLPALKTLRTPLTSECSSLTSPLLFSVGSTNQPFGPTAAPDHAAE